MGKVAGAINVLGFIPSIYLLGHTNRPCHIIGNQACKVDV